LSEVEEAIDELVSVLDDYRAETPCAVCGDTGYTLPCIRCDKPVCVDHSYGAGFCDEHSLTREAIKEPPFVRIEV
jgi:hypothetical protein